MAPLAEFPGLFFPDYPGMGLVAVETVQFCPCQMQIMLSHPRLAPVARLKTVLARRFDLSMRLMAIETFQG